MISRAQIGQVLKIYEAQRTHPSSKPVGAENRSTDKDKIVLSASRDDIDRIQRLVEKLPDIRFDKVESLKKEMEAGTYKVDAAEVADKLLGRLLADRIK